MSDASLDAQLELKKRARRRLVGAAALALLAAIVLPMVMDHEPKQQAQDIQIRIPSQDLGKSDGFTSRILPAKPATTPLPPPVEPAPAPRAEPAPALEAAAGARVPPPAAPKPGPELETKPEPPQVAASSAPKPGKPAKAAASQSEEARVKAALGGAGEQAAGGEQWIVQLGAYREAANVKLLLAKIKELGLPTYTEPFDSPNGPRTRVRAGPFASRDAADKAQLRIKAIGLNGPVARK